MGQWGAMGIYSWPLPVVIAGGLLSTLRDHDGIILKDTRQS